MNRYQCSLVICSMVICFVVRGNSYIHDESMLQHRLDQTVQQFKKNTLHTEHSLEQLLALLDAELTLVEYLQTDETGMKVEDAVNERERLRAESVPVVEHLYNVIMDFATYNPLLISPTSYLNIHERNAYFKRIYDTLERYYAEFQTMQYRTVHTYRS